MCATGTCDDCLRNVAVLSGLNGRNGIDGNRIQIGTGAPNNGDFNDDDFYIDRNPPLNFYHKVAGAWVFIGRLQGLDGNGFFFSESTLISSNQLLNSLASPVVITQVPPAGYAIIPVSITGSLHYNSIPYVTQYGVSIVYLDSSTTVIAALPQDMFTGTTSIMKNAPVFQPVLNPAGVAMGIKPMYPGNITAGNSELLVRIIYYITPV
jgi:hypothetical protein